MTEIDSQDTRAPRDILGIPQQLRSSVKMEAAVDSS